MTTPLPSFLMSRNFDFPPATPHSNSSTAADQETFLQDFGLNGIRSAQNTTMEEDSSSAQSNTRRSRIRESAIRDEIRRRSLARASAYGSGILASNEHVGTSGHRFRPQVGSGSRHQSRYTYRPHDESSGSPARGVAIQQAVDRLSEATSSLHSLLGHHTPRLSSPEINTREYSGEAEVNRRRAKRRKLDGDPLASSFQGFSYGYYGQVVPGKLKMEILSCDGGLHTDARHGTEYCYENVLRNDKSVYCTDSNNCNIIMCHQGKTSFCLHKLVIKAPERGFTSPIQEGMIFISMTSDDLLEKTARYRVREASPPQVLSTENSVHSERPTLPYDVTRESNGNRPTLPYGIGRGSNENRPPSRRLEWSDGGVARTVPPPISDQSLYYDLAPHRRVLAFPPDALTSPPRRASFPPNPVSFAVTTDCDDQSGDEEEEPSSAILTDRLRRDLLHQPYESSSEETEDGVPYPWVTSSAFAMTLHPSQRRSRRRANPSRIEIAEPQSDENQDEQDGKSKRDVLEPHATFFIEMQKSRISIKFDPPVSGKFILLKLWSPAKSQNIDIQSIIAHGFAGPRFFPAIQLM